MALKISTRTIDGVSVVDCSGRVVFGDEANALRETVKEQLAANQRKIVINLANVSYIDSGGLGTLVGLFTSAHNNGGTVKLAGLNSRVIDLLQVTKLVTVFEVFDTAERAASSFKTAAVA
jgi:anti-sigma B factor antagonist